MDRENKKKNSIGKCKEKRIKDKKQTNIMDVN